MVVFQNEGIFVFRNWVKNEVNVYLIIFMLIFFLYLNLMIFRKLLMGFFMNYSKNCWEKQFFNQERFNIYNYVLLIKYFNLNKIYFLKK